MTRAEAAWSLSASLAAHVALGAAVVLAGPRGPGAPRDSRPEAITRLRLVPGGGSGGGAAGVEPSRPVRRAEQRPRAAAPAARVEPPAAAPPAAGGAGPVGPSSAEPLAPEVPGAGAPGAEGASGGGVQGGAERAAGTGAGDSMALARLARRLEEVARGCYPAAARKLRLRGEVGLVFCVGEGGLASAIRVERSSGSPLLDGAAAECVVPRALPSPGASGCFSLPVRFGVSE